MAHLDTEYEGKWQTVILNFNNIKEWPNMPEDQDSIDIELRVFLKNFQDKSDRDSDLTNFDDKLDGFLGIGPCMNDKSAYHKYSFYHQLEKKLGEKITSLTWNVSNTKLFDLQKERSGSLQINNNSVNISEFTVQKNISVT